MGGEYIIYFCSQKNLFIFDLKETNYLFSLSIIIYFLPLLKNYLFIFAIQNINYLFLIWEKQLFFSDPKKLNFSFLVFIFKKWIGIILFGTSDVHTFTKKMFPET